MKTHKNKVVTITTVGFALFAMFFGAGNLILPPLIGLSTGRNWVEALVGFFISAIIAPFLGILVVTKSGTSFTDLGKKVHPKLIDILAVLIILCIGPLVAIPRTGATTFEVGIRPSFPELSNVVFAIIFFAIVLVLSISRTTIVNIIGKFLTPVLLLSLFALIILGVLYPAKPIGEEIAGFYSPSAFSVGFTEGYQTLDVLASVIFAGIIISAVVSDGYSSVRERVKITISAGMISTLALLIIYGGLIYLGATSDYLEATGVSPSEISRTNLLLHISTSILGKVGTFVMAIAIAFACLTTAIALTSATGSIFEKMSKDKIPYKLGVTLCTVVSAFISTNSVDSIINYAINILLFIYPIVFTLILYILLFGRIVESKKPFIASIVVTALISLISVLKNLNLNWNLDFLFRIKEQLPLNSYHLEWLLPSLITFVIFTTFSRRK
ncbi:branched-chain amino acid transport system II carrier protein [Capnocytophaga cynodegmi]|uniref:Branched-chain amino acid uptake carrier braB n=1 Tax=Capnocytophaga cynodegmi TaxID=28189 RepID=A0A0B7HTE5_9FLAO|nr:branched-chain amino acid transport system II carrier protein [Capnocytophaga cynodegmi]CEN34526.1 Branched-chain amino acid uptake carrier braB [Capnocytophaga cynodegmi]CEN41884.1 Branched-chain amino acid uptake carrier braB [Capnocytophaga cynodegmi]